MENLNEVIPAETKLESINAVKCTHNGATNIEIIAGESKKYCMLCGDQVFNK